MNFDELFNEFSKKRPEDNKELSPEDIKPEDYTSTVYLKNGQAFEYSGTMVMDIGTRIAVEFVDDNGNHAVHIYNTDAVQHYEVIRTETGAE